jgi:uncharacterized membrane protein
MRPCLARASVVVIAFLGNYCLAGATIQILDFNPFGVSGDGSVAVGYGHGPSPSSAYRWSRTDGTTELGRLPGDASAFAWGASADGSVVTGSSVGTNDGFRWTANEGMRAFAPDLGQPFQALGVSRDGKTIVGSALSGGGQVAGVVTAQHTLLVLGDLPGARTHAKAYDVSADGSVVVGRGVSEASEQSGFFGLNRSTE